MMFFFFLPDSSRMVGVNKFFLPVGWRMVGWLCEKYHIASNVKGFFA